MSAVPDLVLSRHTQALSGHMVVCRHDAHYDFDRVQAMQRPECFDAVDINKNARKSRLLTNVVPLVGVPGRTSGEQYPPTDDMQKDPTLPGL